MACKMKDTVQKILLSQGDLGKSKMQKWQTNLQLKNKQICSPYLDMNSKELFKDVC